MKIVWLYFLLRKKLGLAKIGQPPRTPARPSSKDRRGLKLEEMLIDRFSVFRVNPAEATKRVVYLHGGGYVQPIAKQHWQLITRIAREANAEVIVPCYGLSPRYKVQDAIAFLKEAKGVFTEDLPLVLMGDSAGGGLALSLAQSAWAKVELLVLISPWVDSEFGEEFAKYEQRDPWLNASSLKYIATVWSGVGDFRTKLVSPLRASMRSLPKTLLFAGDYELFYPDLIALRDKMMGEGVDIDFIEANGGLHVFPLIPVPEGLKAQRQIVDAVRLL